MIIKTLINHISLVGTRACDCLKYMNEYAVQQIVSIKVHSSDHEPRNCTTGKSFGPANNCLQVNQLAPRTTVTDNDNKLSGG